MEEERDLEPSATFDWTTCNAPSTAVVTAVAAETGTDPRDLEPLYDVVDPDSLDGLFTPTTDSGRVPVRRFEFAYEGYLVVVEAEGRGSLYERDRFLQSSDSGPSLLSCSSDN